MSDNESTPPGWHPDPLGRYEYRYWEGTKWSGHVSTDGVTAWDPLEGEPVAENAEAQPKERKGPMHCKDLADTPLRGNYKVTARASKDATQNVFTTNILSAELKDQFTGGDPDQPTTPGGKASKSKTVAQSHEVPARFYTDSTGIVQVTTLDAQPIGYLKRADSEQIAERMEWVTDRVSGSVIFECTLHIETRWAYPSEGDRYRTFAAELRLAERTHNYFSGTIAPA